MNERERRDLFWDCVSWTVNIDVDIKSREDNYASALVGEKSRAK